MSTIYIIRHAHKEHGEYYNLRLCHQDEPLSQPGQEQAYRLWSYFYEKEISAIYVSAYRRTRETIEYVSKQLGITPIMDGRLNEIDSGCIEGMRDEDIQKKYSDIWRGFRERAADFRFPEGETGEEARQQIADFLEEKRQRDANKDLIVVSPDGLSRLMAWNILGLRVYQCWNFAVDFCGIMEIAYQPEYNSWKLLRFNQKLFQAGQVTLSA